MQLPVQRARLIEKRSDERDRTLLANAQRDLANQQVNAWPKVITTTDATVTTVWSDTLPPNSVADLWVAVVGLTADGMGAAAYRRRGVFQRAGAAAVIALGGTADIIGTDRETDPTWDVAFALDAAAPDTIFLTVKGAVGATVTWRANITGIVQPWTT